MKFKLLSKSLAEKYPQEHKVIVEALIAVNDLIKGGVVGTRPSLSNDVVAIKYKEKGRTIYRHATRSYYSLMRKNPSDYNNIEFNLAAFVEKYYWIIGTEYKSFSRDPVIGSMVFANRLDFLRRVVYHETAHLVHLYLEDGILKGEKGHGKEFQQVYRTIVENTQDTYIGDYRHWAGARFVTKPQGDEVIIANAKWPHNKNRDLLPESIWYRVLGTQIESDAIVIKAQPAYTSWGARYINEPIQSIRLSG